VSLNGRIGKVIADFRATLTKLTDTLLIMQQINDPDQITSMTPTTSYKNSGDTTCEYEVYKIS